MRHIFIVLLAALAFGKDKPVVTIQVVSSQASVRESTFTTPATASKAKTSCDTSSDYYANTDCTTTITPGVPAETHTNRIQQETVRAIMPNGDHVPWRIRRLYRE